MSHYTLASPSRSNLRNLFRAASQLAMIGLVVWACWGVIPEGYGGWLTCPPDWYGEGRGRRKQRVGAGRRWARLITWRGGWEYVRGSWGRIGWQLWLVIMLCGPLRVEEQVSWWIVVPMVRWGVAVSGAVWPWWGQRRCYQGLRRGLGRLYQLQVLLLVGMNLYHLGEVFHLQWNEAHWGDGMAWLALGGLVREAKGWQVTIEEDDEGSYTVTLEGPGGDRWFIRYRPVDEFDRRMLLNFLRHIWTSVDTPKRPFLRQEWLAAGFGTYQERLSRWQRYREAGDWRRMLSQRRGPLLNQDQIQHIVNVWAVNFWWTEAEVQEHLAGQGLAYSDYQIRQAGRQSGWLQVRRRLRERFHLGPEAVKPKDEWLVERLFEQIETLLSKMESGVELTAQEVLEIGMLQAQRKELGLAEGRGLEKPLPWMYRMEQVLFNWWEDVEHDAVHCTYCGSTQVARKSRKPRYKKYYDRDGELREVAVYRYYCKNPVCPYKTFTNLPAGLLPYSRWPQDVHLLALQGYAWGRGAYRRVGQSIGVSTATAYRWVSAWGGELLPMAALFGIVRCSGVVGVDEKWVKVPKNDKPAGKHKRWMYVYLAVDVYTYDLLHIAIYPYLTQASAQAFLLALRGKGYQPRVIVTDLRQDYEVVIGQVFPQATHHECIFHAMKWIQTQIKQVYGAKYEEEHPEAVTLKKQLYRLFQCKDKRTAKRRYDRVMEKREACVAAMPEAVSIFDTLERHWPQLVNGIGSSIIPKTNNAVELIIRRFDQHYQNFCGFERIETARCFLGAFEMVYRFTPFAQDNQKDKERPPDQRIGGKCPLELAGYDVRKLPIAQIGHGRLLGWPDQALGGLVPNV
jgi:transposase-like protein